jgi:hypothetical protein
MSQALQAHWIEVAQRDCEAAARSCERWPEAEADAEADAALLDGTASMIHAEAAADEAEGACLWRIPKQHRRLLPSVSCACRQTGCATANHTESR